MFNQRVGINKRGCLEVDGIGCHVGQFLLVCIGKAAATGRLLVFQILGCYFKMRIQIFPCFVGFVLLAPLAAIVG